MSHVIWNELCLFYFIIGGIPYIGASVTTVYLAYKAELASHGISVGMDPGVALTILDQALNLQVTYGAVMLSALGQLIQTSRTLHIPLIESDL